MNQLDYQQECSLTRYPFKDGASLRLTNLASTNFSLPNSIIRDAVFTLWDGAVGSIRLSYISYIKNDKQCTLGFTGTGSLQSNIRAYGKYEPRGITTFVGPGIAGQNRVIARVDVDTDELYNLIQELGEQTIDTWTADDNSNSLCVSCLRISAPKINSVTLANTSKTELVTVLNSTSSIGFSEGANVGLTSLNDTVTLNVSRGLGQGLYDGCASDQLLVRRINNTAADTGGRFLLDTDGCYSTYLGLRGGFTEFSIDSTISWNNDLFGETCAVTITETTSPTNGEGAVLQAINNGGYLDLKIINGGQGYAPAHYLNNDPSNGTDNITITVTDKLGNPHVLSVFDYATDGAGSSGLYLKNICVPECTSDNLVEFAHYLNRVTNAAIALKSYVLDAEATYTGWLQHYYDLQTNKTAAKYPYVIAQSTVLNSGTSKYISITCGIYNPNSEAVTVNLGLNCDNTQYSYVTDSAYITQDNLKTQLPNITLSNDTSLLYQRALKCSSVTYVGFVLHQINANTGSASSDVVFNLASSIGSITSTSSYTLSVNPISFNLNVSYSINHGSTSKSIILSVELVDFSHPVSSNTRLTIVAPGYFAATNSVLTADHVTTNLTDKGFVNQALNYTKTNKYSVILTCAASITGVQTIQIVGNNETGYASKSITITL
jgi:hypothetical protein